MGGGCGSCCSGDWCLPDLLGGNFEISVISGSGAGIGGVGDLKGSSVGLDDLVTRLGGMSGDGWLLILDGTDGWTAARAEVWLRAEV
jgi:hypothetical protein